MLATMTGAEERLAEVGLSFQEIDLVRDGEPDVGGCLLAEVTDGMAGLRIVVKRGLAGGVREKFAEWAESRITRFLEHGPEPDGWQPRGDGAWQLCGRLQEMPNLD
jgi:hypothetical protein